MFIINLYRFLCGYVEILVIGEFCSKLLNIFALQKISIWDIETKENRIKFCVSVKDFLRLREVKGKLSFKVKILKKCGLPFVVKKRVKRIGVVLGIALFFITLQFLSNYIWTVRVEGNAVIAKEEIVACCEKIGVRSGMRRSEVDSGYLRERLLLECDELAWCSFNIEGSRLTVNVTEISSPSNSQPSNIVSDFDGVITEIFVESGTALVKKSDAVRKGDVLISGVIEGEHGNKFVNSAAKIKADIFETIIERGEFSAENLYKNGKSKEKCVLELFSIKLPLYLGETTLPNESKLIKKEAILFGEPLPIKLYLRKFDFVSEETVVMTRDELLLKLSEKIERKINDISFDCEVIDRNIRENEDGIEVKYEIRYEKCIGIEEKLNFDIPK